MASIVRSAGTYITQPSGYRAFVPHDLPPSPPIEIDNEMQILLSGADRALGRLDGSIQSLPTADMFVYMYLRKEAVLSSKIEGTQASLSDVLKAEAKIANPDAPNDADEIINYVDALNFGLKRLETLPLSLRLVREIHQKLMQGVRGHHKMPGEFRTSQNWIGPEGSTLSQALFVPPPPQELMRLLGHWENFTREYDGLPLLIKAGLVHAHFETLHPFLDGNGRIGRLMITLILCEQKVLIKPVLYLSYYFRRHRSRYYDLLQGVRDDGNWEAWLNFFLTGVSEVSNAATDTARRIVEMRELHRAALINSLGRGAANGLKLLESLYQQPYFSVQSAAKILNLSNAAANTLAERFSTLGLVEEITGNRRNRIFSYDSYIGLFAD